MTLSENGKAVQKNRTKRKIIAKSGRVIGNVYLQISDLAIDCPFSAK